MAATNDRLLYLSGAPLSYLKTALPLDSLSITPLSYVSPTGQRMLDVNSQKQILQLLTEKLNLFGQPATYLAGATPVDKPCYDLAITLCRMYYTYCGSIKRVPEVKWFDIGNVDWAYLKSDCAPQLVVFHGLTDQSEGKKIELARDLIRQYEDTTVFVLANTKNIADYAINKMGMSPSGVFQLSRSIDRKVM